MTRNAPIDLSSMDRKFFEELDPAARVELLCRLHALALEQAERLGQNSSNSSRPPSSDGPFGLPEPRSGGPGSGLPLPGLPLALPPKSGSPTAVPQPPADDPPKRRRGKQPGAKGKWRCAALEPEATRNHYPDICSTCGTPFELWDSNQQHSAHLVLDLERTAGGIRIACVRHADHATRCACGAVTIARPGMGALSVMPGRRRDLLLSEAGLVGPALATFIAALSVRFRLSRGRIREFLLAWFGVSLSAGTLDRCIREVGVACEPVVEDLDLAPPDRTRSDVCHAAAFMSISAWACAGVL